MRIQMHFEQNFMMLQFDQQDHEMRLNLKQAHDLWTRARSMVDANICVSSLTSEEVKNCQKATPQTVQLYDKFQKVLRSSRTVFGLRQIPSSSREQLKKMLFPTCLWMPLFNCWKFKECDEMMIKDQWWNTNLAYFIGVQETERLHVQKIMRFLWLI